MYSLQNYGFVSVVDACVFGIVFVLFSNTVLLYCYVHKRFESWILNLYQSGYVDIPLMGKDSAMTHGKRNIIMIWMIISLAVKKYKNSVIKV